MVRMLGKGQRKRVARHRRGALLHLEQGKDWETLPIITNR